MTSIDLLVQEWLRLDKVYSQIVINFHFKKDFCFFKKKLTIFCSKNPTTRSEIEKLYADQNIDELEKRLRNRISFGTAGTYLVLLKRKLK